MKDNNFLLIFIETELDIITMEEPFNQTVLWFPLYTSWVLNFKSAEERLKYSCGFKYFPFFILSDSFCLLELTDLN